MENQTLYRRFSISNFDNQPSLDSANLSNSQSKHSTIASISSVPSSVFERIANQMWVNDTGNFVSNSYRATYFSSSWFDAGKQKSDSVLLYIFLLSATFFQWLEIKMKIRFSFTKNQRLILQALTILCHMFFTNAWFYI